MSNDRYTSPLSERYASKEMQYIFSPDKKFRTWRKLWIALAETEKELGLDITEEQIEELKAHADDINYDVAKEREKVVRHDVMSHVYAYGKQCPNAKGIIHLGATSCYVGDNTDIILMSEALEIVRKKLINVIAELAKFADAHKSLPTLAFTHFQPAQPTTVGKRATLWMQEFMMDLEDLEYVKSVTSMANTLPEGVPEDFLPYSITSQLHTDTTSRMLIYIRTKSESDKAFEYTNDIRDIVKKYYPEDSYVAGETPSTQDIKTTITADNARVNVLSLISVFVVVMFSFQSVLVPIIVMIPIEAAIYINMAVPYLVGETLVYMGYIIVSSIQLGATVDYSILLTNNYMTCRKTMKKKEAVVEALAMSCSSVFTSGTILILAGYIVYMISSTAAIGGLGHLIGRGALFSVCLVLTILPALLVLCDGIITSNEMDRFKKYLKRRHEKRKALVKSGIGAVKKKASAALARRGSQTAEVDGNEI